MKILITQCHIYYQTLLENFVFNQLLYFLELPRVFFFFSFASVMDL